jgi:superfamily I DNA/RNA helicase
MRRLYLVRATRRAVFGEVMETEPSRFLANIPADLLRKKGT